MARLEKGEFCPLIKENCIGLKCSWYTQVRGTDPQSGNEVDEYACAVAWLPMLLIETSKEVRQGAAATETLRNKTVEAADTALRVQLTIAAMQGLSLPLAIEKKDGL